MKRTLSVTDNDILLIIIITRYILTRSPLDDLLVSTEPLFIGSLGVKDLNYRRINESTILMSKLSQHV